MLLFRTSRLSWFLFCFLFDPCSCNLQSGFSQLQRGHRLDRSMINSFPEFSFLDCVTECLVTPRCASVNYFKGANFCELNYEKKQTAYTKFTESPGWVYSEKDHWPEELAGACSKSNCSLNEKCVHTKYTEEKFFQCVISDFGLPNRTGINMSRTKREDAIGIHRRLHATCSDGYFQFGSGRLICQSNGQWKYDILCEKKAGWVQFGNHVYHLSIENKTWEIAKDHCESMDAYLVEIESLEENTWIYHTSFLKIFGGRKRCGSVAATISRSQSSSGVRAEIKSLTHIGHWGSQIAKEGTRTVLICLPLMGSGMMSHVLPQFSLYVKKT